jgi:hypothetical protein
LLQAILEVFAKFRSAAGKGINQIAAGIQSEFAKITSIIVRIIESSDM